MNFANVKSITIPEGKVTKITSGSVVIWQLAGSSAPAYTNVLPFATDTDRKTIYGGKGYRTGYRLSSSSGGVTAATGMCASGFIPCKVGDILRIKGTKPKNGTASYVMSFDSNNKKVGVSDIGQKGAGPVWVDKDEIGYGCADYNSATDTLTIVLDSATFGTGWNAIRFSAGVIDDSTIVTINEQIILCKNWVKYSTESYDKTIYNNGLGYKNGCRVRSGGAEGDQADASCSGFIPVKEGDVVGLGGGDFTGGTAANAINVYDASYTNLGQVVENFADKGYGIFADGTLSNWNNGTIRNGCYYWTVPSGANIAYIRVTERMHGNGQEMVVAVNEEII